MKHKKSLDSVEHLDRINVGSNEEVAMSIFKSFSLGNPEVTKVIIGLGIIPLAFNLYTVVDPVIVVTWASSAKTRAVRIRSVPEPIIVLIGNHNSLL